MGFGQSDPCMKESTCRSILHERQSLLEPELRPLHAEVTEMASFAAS